MIRPVPVRGMPRPFHLRREVAPEIAARALEGDVGPRARIPGPRFVRGIRDPGVVPVGRLVGAIVEPSQAIRHRVADRRDDLPDQLHVAAVGQDHAVVVLDDEVHGDGRARGPGVAWPQLDIHGNRGVAGDLHHRVAGRQKLEHGRKPIGNMRRVAEAQPAGGAFRHAEPADADLRRQHGAHRARIGGQHDDARIGQFRLGHGARRRQPPGGPGLDRGGEGWIHHRDGAVR